MKRELNNEITLRNLLIFLVVVVVAAFYLVNFFFRVKSKKAKSKNKKFSL